MLKYASGHYAGVLGHGNQPGRQRVRYRARQTYRWPVQDSNITQVQLAETLNISQSAVNAYELGDRRVPVSALLPLARVLGVGLEELLGKQMLQRRNAPPAPKLQQQMDRLSQLPKTKQRFIMEVIESVLAQQSR